MVNYAQLRTEYRQKRLLMGIPFVDNDMTKLRKKPSIGWVVGLVTVLFIGGCLVSRPAHAYTDEQIVNAIYKAEGGAKAQYPYGIRSVSCASTKECKKICLNTVRANRKRFTKNGYKKYGDFISFLGSRYCPTTGRTLSKAESKVNKYWIKNVMLFLNKEVA